MPAVTDRSLGSPDHIEQRQALGTISVWVENIIHNTPIKRMIAMQNLFLVLPLVVIFILMLPPIKAHVLIAGFVGGVLAIIIGRLCIGQATDLFLSGVSELFAIASIILFPTLAYVLSRAGAMESALSLANKAFNGKTELIVPLMVLSSALATYASGTGAGNIIISAPLILSAVGFLPLVVGALGVASAAAWSVSPAAAETAFIADAMGLEVGEYVSFMRPYALIMWIFSLVLSYKGVKIAQKQGHLMPGVLPGKRANILFSMQEKDLIGDPSSTDWARTTPFIVLLLLIFLSPVLNSLLQAEVFTPFTIPFIVLALAAVLIKIPLNDLAKEFIESGKVILGILFMVGMFIGFTNMLNQIGTFEVIAHLPSVLPRSLLGVSALFIGFLIAIPAGTYTTAVLIIIVPILQAIGLNPLLFGFLTMIVAQGAMMCPAQVSVAASSLGFKASITKIVSNNAKIVPFSGLIVIIMALIVAGF